MFVDFPHIILTRKEDNSFGPLFGAKSYKCGSGKLTSNVITRAREGRDRVVKIAHKAWGEKIFSYSALNIYIFMNIYIDQPEQIVFIIQYSFAASHYNLLWSMFVDS